MWVPSSPLRYWLFYKRWCENTLILSRSHWTWPITLQTQAPNQSESDSQNLQNWQEKNSHIPLLNSDNYNWKYVIFLLISIHWFLYYHCHSLLIWTLMLFQCVWFDFFFFWNSIFYEKISLKIHTINLPGISYMISSSLSELMTCL